MAKDLTSFKITPEGASASATHLASVSKDGASHLAVIRLTKNWANKQFVVTPSEKRFTCAVASALSSLYTSVGSASLAQEGEGIASSLAGVWTAKTNESWHTGQKAVCQYIARGDGPYYHSRSSKPYTHEKNIEYGGTRIALKFNTLGFPLPKCTSFSAALRIWNPSYLFNNPASGVVGLATSYNTNSQLHFNFSADLPAPSHFEAADYGSADFAAIANRGTISSSGTAVVSFAEDYDIWNSNNGSISGSFSNALVVVFKGGTQPSQANRNSYYSDIQITGNLLEKLKSLMSAGSFWLVAGFHVANPIAAQYQNKQWYYLQPNNTVTAYASRIELVFTASANTFN